MKSFMDEDFLLSTETAKKLYHEHAEKMPIIDYHCHINPQEIAENHKFENIFQVWLGGDHYKWRAIRSNGVPEKYIIGNETTDKEKFEKWAETLPRAIGNPLYHWTHLELNRYFNYNKPLSAKTCDEVWELCNEQLQKDSMSVRGLIEQSNVKLICTTDDPADDLKYHKMIAADPTCKVKVLPAFRPDKALYIERVGFAEYIAKLSSVCQKEITTVAELCEALGDRIAFFNEMGCRASDHGLDYIPYVKADDAKLNEIFHKGLKAEALTKDEIDAFKTALLLFCGKQYARYGWVMQLHYGVLRNNNTAMFNAEGADTGYDSMGSFDCAWQLSRVLDTLNKENALPKTILYSINPSDNAMLGSMIGCFQGDIVPGKLQHGSAWWFNDTRTGMEQQLQSLANLSLLGNFVGMLTDSRSFLSYTRHEYFRRILCNFIGKLVENGEYPNDMEMLGKMVEDISYNNTVRYFGFQVD